MKKVRFHWGIPAGSVLGNLLVMAFGVDPVWGFTAGILFASWLIWFIENEKAPNG